MGHSMGNFVTTEKLLQSYDSEALRLYYAMRHYRSQLEFVESDISQAQEVLDKLRAVHTQFKTIMKSAPLGNGELDKELEQLSSSAKQSFADAMDDDFNTPRALASMIRFSKEVESHAARPMNKSNAALVINTLDYFGSVFGILQAGNVRQDRAFEELLRFLLKMREDARKRGDWTAADSIRDNLTKIGVGLEDTPAGVRWYLMASSAQVKSG